MVSGGLTRIEDERLAVPPGSYTQGLTATECYASQADLNGRPNGGRLFGPPIDEAVDDAGVSYEPLAIALAANWPLKTGHLH